MKSRPIAVSPAISSAVSSTLALAFALTLGLAATASLVAQQEGSVPTQMLVNVDPKSTPPANASDLTVSVDNRKQPLSAWSPVLPAGAEVALLIDDGLRASMGRELGNLRAFINGLPSGIEVLAGYMENGRVVVGQPFTADHALAASALRIPEGVPGASASPYFCLSDFVKHWPSAETVDPNAAPTIERGRASATQRKARFVLMISNGVDPYNGSTSLANQDSPYVATAVADAQRAGVAVYTIYYTDAGIRGPDASVSGQSYLAQLSQATGGANYFEGTGNPVSMAPFLTAFQHALAATYIAGFEAPPGKDPARDMVRIKLTTATKAKLHAPDEVRPGNQE
jgi:hypothetical protein